MEYKSCNISSSWAQHPVFTKSKCNFETKQHETISFHSAKYQISVWPCFSVKYQMWLILWWHFKTILNRKAKSNSYFTTKKHAYLGYEHKQGHVSWAEKNPLQKCNHNVEYHQQKGVALSSVTRGTFHKLSSKCR